MNNNSSRNESLTKLEEKKRVLHSIKGFNVIKRDFNNKIYLQYICYKENKIIAELLASRNVKPEDRENFLEPRLKNLLPKTISMKDVLYAVKRIIQAIDNKEKICIFGDYDVDGITSTTLLISFFEQLGIEVSYYIPDRILEGYGPNCEAMDKISKNNIKLLISVDCGTTAFEPFEKAKSLGIDVIIIDHHQSSEKIPECIACVNPNRLDEKDIRDDIKCLCACGVLFFVIIAINKELKKQKLDIDLMQFTPLVALATICDVMKMTPLNRAFVKTGINVLQKTKSFNLFELIDVFETKKTLNQQKNIYKQNTKITYNSLGFIIGPMINAGGRIGNSSLGVQLMIEKNKQQARIIAEELCELNEERKQIESDALCEIVGKKDEIQSRIEQFGFIMLFSKSWHEGIIGLMASRVKDKYFYPTFIGTEISGEKIIKFSCRSVENVDIGNIIIEAREKQLLFAGGGHKLAGGMSCEIDKIEKFQNFLKERIKKDADEYFLNKTKKYDVAISLGGLTVELLEKIKKFEPFGVGNDKPFFLIQDVFIKKINVIKDKHISVSLLDNENYERAICFNCINTKIGDFLLSAEGKFVTLLATAEIEDRNDRKQKNIAIEDIIT